MLSFYIYLCSAKQSLPKFREWSGRVEWKKEKIIDILIKNQKNTKNENTAEVGILVGRMSPGQAEKTKSRHPT